MRTTVDLPDDLLRQAKARAALEGVRLRDLIEAGLRQVISGPGSPLPSRRVEFPLIRSEKPNTLTPDEVTEAQERAMNEEDQRHGLPG